METEDKSFCEVYGWDDLDEELWKKEDLEKNYTNTLMK
jgi:hypothetical protein